jgi:hypothetical protein
MGTGDEMGFRAESETVLATPPMRTLAGTAAVGSDGVPWYQERCHPDPPGERSTTPGAGRA